MYLPIGLFGISIATAALPDISRHAADDDRRPCAKTISGGLRMMLMLNVPATIGLMVLAAADRGVAAANAEASPGTTPLRRPPH